MNANLSIATTVRTHSQNFFVEGTVTELCACVNLEDFCISNRASFADVFDADAQFCDGSCMSLFLFNQIKQTQP